MNGPDKSSRPFHIDHKTLISFGTALAFGGLIFGSGVLWEKVQKFDSIGAGERLARIEIVIKLIAKQVGVPVEAHYEAKNVVAKPR